ncbi:MAG: cytochrome o ubiquinol oxidase subunit IV [Desulfopila sp.]
MDQAKMNEALGLGHLSVRKYVVGFAQALVLTVISFALIAIPGMSKPAMLTALFIAAILQMLVHLHYFLHLDRSSKQRWNLITLLFSLLLIVIFVGGSIWVMVTLNARMM